MTRIELGQETGIMWYPPIERYTVTLTPRNTLTYDQAIARIAELEAERAAIAAAMGAYADSDLVSLATTLRAFSDAHQEMHVEQEMGY